MEHRHLALCLGLAFVVGCGSALTTDPVSSFKGVVSEIEKNSQDPSSPGKIVDLTYDVKKTDSLVSPFVASAHIKLQTRANAFTDLDVNYAFQEGAWVLKSTKYEMTTPSEIAGQQVNLSYLKGSEYPYKFDILAKKYPADK